MIVFGLVGIFLIKAAVDFNPRAAVGLDGALAKIVHRPYGPLALGLVAAGLVAFALYSLSDARYPQDLTDPMLTAYLFDERRGKDVEDWADVVGDLSKNQVLWVDLARSVRR